MGILDGPLESPVPMDIAFDERGLVPCVIQDWASGEVLTLAYMNAEALAPHARDRRAAPLQPLARRAVAQGRHLGQHAGGQGAAVRLRPRRRAGARRARRAGLPHRRAHLLPQRRARAAAPHEALPGARAHDRRARRRAARGLVHRRAAGRARGWSARRCGRRPRRWRGRRARRATSASPRRPPTSSTTSPCCCARAGSSLADAEEVLHWPASLTTSHVTTSSRSARRFIEDTETPVSRVPEAARLRPGVPARVGRAGPARRPLVVHRLQAAQRAALDARRRRRPVRARGRRGRARTARRRRRSRSRSRAARSASSATTACAPSSGCRSRTPTRVGLPDMALMLSDVIVAFDHLKHTVTILANAYVDERRRPRTSARARRSARCASGWPARCRAAAAPARARAGVRVQHAARGVRGDGRAHHRVRPRRRRVPGRAVAALVGARRRSSRSRSTAGCARSTRRRTCTSWTSRTSSSSAPRRSRCSR